jgi:hypothetical protein
MHDPFFLFVFLVVFLTCALFAAPALLGDSLLKLVKRISVIVRNGADTRISMNETAVRSFSVKVTVDSKTVLDCESSMRHHETHVLDTVDRTLTIAIRQLKSVPTSLWKWVANWLGIHPSPADQIGSAKPPLRIVGSKSGEQMRKAS